MATTSAPRHSAVLKADLLKSLCNRGTGLIEERLVTTQFPPPILSQALLECSTLAAVMKGVQFLLGHGKLPAHIDALLGDDDDKSVVKTCIRALDDLEGLLEPYPNQEKPTVNGELSSLHSLLEHVLALKYAIGSAGNDKSP